MVGLNSCHKGTSCSSSNEWWSSLNIKYFTQLTCSQTVLKRIPFVLLRSAISLCTSSHSSSIQRNFEISWYTWKWCNKTQIKPKRPAHSNRPCDAMESWQFQICFHSINMCSDIIMNNWGRFLWMFTPLPQFLTTLFFLKAMWLVPTKLIYLWGLQGLKYLPAQAH